MLYPSTSKGPFKMNGVYGKDSKRNIGIIYRPDTWQADTVYLSVDGSFNVVMPTVFKGFYFRVINPGKSGATEPVWPTQAGDTVEDGATFEAVAYNLLPINEDISTSTFTASHGVTLYGAINTAGTTHVMISDIPDGVTSFTVANHIVKSNGEEESVSLLFKVAER